MRGDVPGTPPAIGPAPDGPGRPTWSVMIPTYNASSFLEEALRSVLDQDPGPERMQVAVVDDCSPAGEARRIVDRLAPGRVEFHRGRSNLGLAGNWNACVGLSRGRWVHVLHQDDLVFPGFYERLGRADADPSVGMAFCQNAYIGEDGAWNSISWPERQGAGVISDWLARLSRGQRVQCAAVAVRRSVYEELGGFRADLRYVLDWEMWVRIAARHSAWYEPTVLACYRSHRGSETARLRKAASDLDDFRQGLGAVAAHLPPGLREGAGRETLDYLIGEGLREVGRRLGEGDHRGALEQFRAVCRHKPELRFSRAAFGYRKWALKLWVGERLGRPAGPGPGHPGPLVPAGPGIGGEGGHG